MSSAKLILVLCFVTPALGLPLSAAEIGSDLKATIALQGLPCDQVLKQSRIADSDYKVSCKDGNRYHVFVNSQGRVVVQRSQ